MAAKSESTGTWDRRGFMGFCAALGLGGGPFAEALWRRSVDEKPITAEMIAVFETIAGLSFAPEERIEMARRAQEYRADYARLRAVDLPNRIAPAFVFSPVAPDRTPSFSAWALPPRPVAAPRPEADDLAFASITQLGAWIRGKVVTSEAVTRACIERLERVDPVLHCVVNLTKERALAAARRADAELARGEDRGPLHGIPWGAKDLLATRGVPTTWGAEPFRDQILDFDATVVERLDRAGAVLVAKLTTGALAMGDRWFGGRTRNPWNPERGSSGSSAGPAAAVAAGCVPFAIGSETLGSIVSPCTRCGATGLRPTFGRVSRHGAMALSWTMDKLGPITRSALDAALVFDAIHGADGLDHAAVDRPFDVEDVDWGDLRVGYLAEDFAARRKSRSARARAIARLDDAVLSELKRQGARLEPVELPDLPYRSLLVILDAEAACAFDDITRDGRVRELVSQGRGAWPNVFRGARTIPAVEYLRASRARTRLVEEVDSVLGAYDLVVAPTHQGNALVATNLSGHPCIVMPCGFAAAGMPWTITFLGPFFGEGRLVAAARRWQEATHHHEARPPLG